MTELLFPGGIVRIDEGHVWRELSRFAATGGSYVLTSPEAQGDQHHYCTLRLGAGTWRGKSLLSAAEAVANALATWARDPKADAGVKAARP